MCGILGVLAFGDFPEKKQEKLRQEAMIFLSSELLQLTQSRGKDATGIATMFSNCDYMGLKMGIPPTDFVARFGGTEKDFDGYINIWRKKTVPAKMILGHCRKSSVGNPEDNTNNHPIKVDDIIGIHNGTLTNHNRIFELLKCDRSGTVDSEAIFRLLHYFTNNGKEPFAPELIQEVCRRLHGTYACLTFTGNNPYQMVGFRDSRPLEALLIKPLKLLLMASEKDFLKHVIFRYNKMANLYQLGTTKFPPLKKTDVELSSLPDDHLYIFDIRKEVENVSKIEDLFIKERIPRNNKIWDTKYNSQYTPKTNYLDNATNTPKTNYLDNATRKAENFAKEVKKKSSRLGMAWNKEIKNYQDVTELEESKSYSSVEINSKNGQVVDAETKKVLITETITHAPTSVMSPLPNNTGQKFNLIRTYSNVDSALTTEQAKITEYPIPVKNLPVAVNTISNKTEVILETNPEALKKAEVALQKEKQFKSDQEVQFTLDIDEMEHLTCLHPYILGNKIRKFFYKKGWYNGYMSHLHETAEIENVYKNELTSKKLLIRANNKRKLAENNIRIMKNIIYIFSHITTEYGITSSDVVSEVGIKKAINAVLTNSNELTMDLIKNVFKPGDFRKIPILRKITSLATTNKHED